MHLNEQTAADEIWMERTTIHTQQTTQLNRPQHTIE